MRSSSTFPRLDRSRLTCTRTHQCVVEFVQQRSERPVRFALVDAIAVAESDVVEPQASGLVVRNADAAVQEIRNSCRCMLAADETTSPRDYMN